MSLTKVPCAGCGAIITIDDYSHECSICGEVICSQCWNDPDYGGLCGNHYHEAKIHEKEDKEKEKK